MYLNSSYLNTLQQLHCTRVGLSLVILVTPSRALTAAALSGLYGSILHIQVTYVIYNPHFLCRGALALLEERDCLFFFFGFPLKGSLYNYRKGYWAQNQYRCRHTSNISITYNCSFLLSRWLCTWIRDTQPIYLLSHEDNANNASASNTNGADRLQ